MRGWEGKASSHDHDLSRAISRATPISSHGWTSLVASALAVDAGSLDRILSEVAAAYAAGAAPVADPETASYAQYAAWREAVADDDADGEGRAYWRDHLGTGAPPLRLPYRRAGSAAGPAAPIQLSRTVDADLAEAFARALARPDLAAAGAGADVAVVDLDEGAAAETVSLVEAEGRRALAVGVDVGDRDAVFAAFDRIVAELGRVDGLVNCAAVISENVPVEEATEADLDRLPPMEEMEDEMLWGAAQDRQDNSRLSCQLKVTEGCDLHVTTPATQV